MVFLSRIWGDLTSQQQRSKGGRRDEPNEKTSFCMAGSRYPVVFSFVKNHNFWVGDFLSVNAKWTAESPLIKRHAPAAVPGGADTMRNRLSKNTFRQLLSE